MMYSSAMQCLLTKQFYNLSPLLDHILINADLVLFYQQSFLIIIELPFHMRAQLAILLPLTMKRLSDFRIHLTGPPSFAIMQ